MPSPILSAGFLQWQQRHSVLGPAVFLCVLETQGSKSCLNNDLENLHPSNIAQAGALLSQTCHTHGEGSSLAEWVLLCMEIWKMPLKINLSGYSTDGVRLKRNFSFQVTLCCFLDWLDSFNTVNWGIACNAFMLSLPGMKQEHNLWGYSHLSLWGISFN